MHCYGNATVKVHISAFTELKQRFVPTSNYLLNSKTAHKIHKDLEIDVGLRVIMIHDDVPSRFATEAPKLGASVTIPRGCSVYASSS